jgi:GNAT superfamily N-acetyltransferase
MSDYQVRAATPDDLAVVLHHRRRMFEDMGFTDPGALDRMTAVSTPLIARGLADGSYQGWLAEAAGAHVVAGGGVILVEFQPHPRDPQARRAFVVNMFTEPEHRRRGLARLVMQAILDSCRAQGMRFLYLHASDSGRALYESLGFAPTNEMRLTL